MHDKYMAISMVMAVFVLSIDNVSLRFVVSADYFMTTYAVSVIAKVAICLGKFSHRYLLMVLAGLVWVVESFGDESAQRDQQSKQSD